MNMMRFGCAALTMILLAINGCVELTGQRLSFRYDAEKDELTALLFYDGIHHANQGLDMQTTDILDDNSRASDSRDIDEFVKNGDIMLGDWVGHLFQPAKIKEELAEPDFHAMSAKHQLMKLALESVHTHPIGHYRDAHGRIGAAQRITITNASKLVAAGNAWINEQLLDYPGGEASNPTIRLMQKSAKENHAWLKLDGNSIVYTMPVDRADWAKMKTKFFTDGMSEFGSDDRSADDPADQRLAQIKRSIGYMTQFLTSTPVSYTEQGGIVTIRLGDPATPNTLRYRVHERYTDNHAEPVKRNIPADLNAMLAKYLLADKPAKNADLDAIIAFGPPEQQVMALIGAARGDDAVAAEKAAAKLRSWAASWNAANSYPQAPTEMPMQPSPTADTPPMSNTAAYFKLWDAWLNRMASYPVDAAPAPGASAAP